MPAPGSEDADVPVQTAPSPPPLPPDPAAAFSEACAAATAAEILLDSPHDSWHPTLIFNNARRVTKAIRALAAAGLTPAARGPGAGGGGNGGGGLHGSPFTRCLAVRGQLLTRATRMQRADCAAAGHFLAQATQNYAMLDTYCDTGDFLAETLSVGAVLDFAAFTEVRGKQRYIEDSLLPNIPEPPQLTPALTPPPSL